ncbi:hypothetical protein GPECTOR_174g208 [Gonium pectorale]|uniref:RING-type domain-containing protein n=1 Tax=Gonium pectorale TaxID=33097 RepID=A0A150FXB3_GONPE|nr:hypothetical protein GPECTOR_174g208 [Gonium pectorale]|eukprot:KXZ42252.1 hypothetical protein GPECTOR_174g208 [Gonium pectorale]
MLGHAAAAIGSKIWMFGGQQGRKFLRTLYVFDTDTCTWSRKDSDAHPPARAGHSMVTVHGSVVYMFGGQGKRLYNDLYKLDPSTGQFVEVEAAGKPPSPRRGHSLVWDGRDYLVCFGGINATSTDAQLSVFSLSRGAWFTPQAFGPAPSARTQHSAQLLSPGVLLIFGGCNSAGTFFNDAVILDTRTFTWHKPALLNTAPAPRYHHTCATVNGRVLIYGGINSKQTFDGVVVVESKFMSDICSVAEELFRMSADTAGASALFGPLPNGSGALGVGAGSAHGASGTLGGGVGQVPMVALRMASAAGPGTGTGTVSGPSSGGLGPATVMPPPHATVQPAHLQAAQQQQQPGTRAGAPHRGPDHDFSSSKSLEAVKVQLTDLLLRRNLEEQHLHTARKVETTESLLMKEREAREATGKELMQHKLLLAEAEEAQAAAEQQLAAATARATREAAVAAELRAQLEAMQAKLSAREEELQEARQLQDSLVKELGIMASRYSRLASDVQEAADRGERERERERERLLAMAAATGSAARRASLTGMVMMQATAAGGSSGAGSTLLVGSGGSGGDSAPDARSVATGSAVALHQRNQTSVAEELAASGSYSLPLPGGHSGLLSATPGAAAFTVHCTASARTTPSAGRDSAAAAGSSGGAVGGAGCCQQLLVLLSECEMARASMVETNQGLTERAEELTAQNALLYGQLQQMLAEPAALEPLGLAELQELERKLDGSARAVREALMQRKIDEAQRRSSSEQACCAVCMEAPKAVVFNCGHQSCGPCAVKLTSCPFCRVSITARIRLFDA